MLGVTTRVQVKNMLMPVMMQYCTSAAQYPLLESIQEGTIHQCLWKAVPYPYSVWEEGMPVGSCSGTWDKESSYVTSSYGWCSIQLKKWYYYEAIYYSVHHYSFCILSFSRLMVCHCSVFSIDVTLLVCWWSFITNSAGLCILSNFWMLALVNGSQI